MYLRFKIYWVYTHEDIEKEVRAWAEKYQVRYTYKTIKGHFRVGFDHEKDFTLFTMTWNPENLEERPWLNYELVNVQNEKY